MKDIDRLKKNSKSMMFIYGFLGLFMMLALLVNNGTKPTYSATCNGTVYNNKCCTCSQGTFSEGNCVYYEERTTNGGSHCTEIESSKVYSCTKLLSQTSSTQISGWTCSWSDSESTYYCTKTDTKTGLTPSQASTYQSQGYNCTGVASRYSCRVVVTASCTTMETNTFTPGCYHNLSTHSYQWYTSQPSSSWIRNDKSQSQCSGCLIGYHLSGSSCVEDSTAPSFTPACYTNNSTHRLDWKTSDPGSAWTKNSLAQSACSGCVSGYHLSNDSCVVDGSCYINQSTHKFEWKTSDPGSGYTKSSKSQSDCTGCATPYVLENNQCVIHTASAAGCYKCTNTYLYYDKGENLGPACATTADSNYIKPEHQSSDICVAKTEYQAAKTVTLTFVGTSTITRSCTIAANKDQCDNDLVAPTEIIDESKVFNGWGETAGCTSGSYTGNATFRITRFSSNRTYYACYDTTDSTKSADYNKSKCQYSMETGVTRDVRYLQCTYTNISYNSDPNNTTGDSRGNIKQCCLDHGYMWIDSNFTSSGWGNEYCIHCGGGTVPSRSTPSTDPEPVTSCYGCKVSNGTKYVYATSSSAAASASGGTGCTVANSSYCNTTPTPTTSCYKCTANGTDKYAFATSKTNAATATGGTDCTTVSDTYCAPKDNCFECTVDGGKSYVIAESASDAKTATGGTSCTTADSTKCTNKNCYECTANGTKKYANVATVTEAKNQTNGTNCKIVDKKYCETPENPKTGTMAMIIAWMAGIMSVAYGLWYFNRSKDLENKKND